MSLRKQATSGLVWTFSQQFGNQLTGFFVSLLLARLLLPEEFGLIGMISIFVAIGNSLLNAGLTQSLIRSKDLDEEDFSTVFYFNIIASIAIYITIYFLAPLIADFYNQIILIGIIRVYSISFILSAFSAVQLARLTKRFDFKTQTIIAIPSTIVGGVLGVILAYNGYGVWSLVWSQLLTQLASTIQVWIYSKWTPLASFNYAKFKTHFNFGYKLTLSGLLEVIFNNIYVVVIGRFFSASQVGFYTRAETMKQLPVANISNALNKVTYPMFASIQDDNIQLKNIYRKLMQLVVFVIAPTLILFGVIAEPLFRFLFTEKWLPAVPYFQILCATGILYPIHAYNLNILKVKGRSDLFLQLEIVKKVILAFVIIITLQYGILALLYGQVFISFLAFLVNSYYSGKFINYNAIDQLKDIFPILLLASLSGALVYFLDNIYFSSQNDILRIGIGLALGMGAYIALAYIFKFGILFVLKRMIFQKF